MATGAHGLVTRGDLLRVGVTVSEIKHRLGRGALLPVHRGVYRVGHRAPSVEARYLAAVLACGDGALLTGRAAAHLLGILKGPIPPPEVTAPVMRRIPSVRTHRSRVAPPDTTTFRAIPVTTVARTLSDIAALLALDDLARACHEAGVRTKPRRPTSRRFSRGGRERRGLRSCAGSFMEMCTSRSASSKPAS